MTICFVSWRQFGQLHLAPVTHSGPGVGSQLPCQVIVHLHVDMVCLCIIKFPTLIESPRIRLVHVGAQSVLGRFLRTDMKGRSTNWLECHPHVGSVRYWSQFTISQATGKHMRRIISEPSKWKQRKLPVCLSLPGNAASAIGLDNCSGKVKLNH